MWWLLKKPVCNKNKQKEVWHHEALDLKFGLGPQASLGDVGFVLLSVSAFTKSASVEEVQQMSWSVRLVADAQLN